MYHKFWEFPEVGADHFSLITSFGNLSYVKSRGVPGGVITVIQQIEEHFPYSFSNVMMYCPESDRVDSGINKVELVSFV